MIYDRLADSSRFKEITLKHLEQFATEGEWTNVAPCLLKVELIIPQFLFMVIIRNFDVVEEMFSYIFILTLDILLSG